MGLLKRNGKTTEHKTVYEQQNNSYPCNPKEEYVRWDNLIEIFQEIANFCRDTHGQGTIDFTEPAMIDNRSAISLNSSGERQEDLLIDEDTLTSYKEPNKLICECEDIWFDIKQTLINLNTLIREQSAKCNGVDPNVIVQMNSLIARFEDIRTQLLFDRLNRVHKSLSKIQEKISNINSSNATMNKAEQFNIDELCRNLRRAEKDTKAALYELESFGICLIAPEVGDLFDGYCMEPIDPIPGVGGSIVERVIEYGYAQSTMQTDNPTVIKKALVQLH